MISINIKYKISAKMFGWKHFGDFNTECAVELLCTGSIDLTAIMPIHVMFPVNLKNTPL